MPKTHTLNRSRPNCSTQIQTTSDLSMSKAYALVIPSSVRHALRNGYANTWGPKLALSDDNNLALNDNFDSRDTESPAKLTDTARAETHVIMMEGKRKTAAASGSNSSAFLKACSIFFLL